MNTQHAFLFNPADTIAIPQPARYLALAVLLLVTFALSACHKNESIPTTAERLKSVEQRQQTQPDFYVPRKVVDYMSDLKSMKENPAKLPPPVIEPPVAKGADAKPASVIAKSAAPATEPPIALPITPPTKAAAARIFAPRSCACSKVSSTKAAPPSPMMRARYSSIISR